IVGDLLGERARLAHGVRPLVVLELGRGPPRAPRLRDLVEVLRGALQAALRPLRLGLRFRQIALAQQPADLAGAVPGALDLLAQRSLPAGDAGEALLEAVDLLALLLDEVVDLAAHPAFHLRLLPIRGGLRLLLQLALVALDVADLL